MLDGVKYYTLWYVSNSLKLHRIVYFFSGSVLCKYFFSSRARINTLFYGLPIMGLRSSSKDTKNETKT